jgi:predicted TIM-barrel fold metal-dependent hydrolase
MVIYGLGYEQRDRPPSSEELVADWGGPITFAIETFGADRCMFESNFPVDKASCSYTVLWNAFKRMTSGCSATEKAKLFHDTAARVYRIEEAR